MRFAACLVVGALATGVACVDARTPDRALIRLSCPEPDQGRASPDEARALCQAMIQALAETAGGGPVVTRVARGAETPDRPGDIGIALYLDARGAGVLRGHLEWQATGMPRQAADEVAMTLSDAPLSPAAFGRFARGLLRATPGVVAALQPGPGR